MLAGHSVLVFLSCGNAHGTTEVNISSRRRHNTFTTEDDLYKVITIEATAAKLIKMRFCTIPASVLGAVLN